VSAIFFLIHNAIRNASVLYYFDYVARGGTSILLTASLGRCTSSSTGPRPSSSSARSHGRRRPGHDALHEALRQEAADRRHHAAERGLGAGVLRPAPDAFSVLVAANFAWSVLAGATPVLLFAMYADVADYYEWKFRRRATGLVISGIMFAIKAGIAIGGFMTLRLLAAFHYVPNQAQARRPSRASSSCSA